MQKFLQTDMIVFDQFIVPTIKFGKCFAEFMRPIASLNNFGSYEFVRLLKSLTCEDALAKRIS